MFDNEGGFTALGYRYRLLKDMNEQVCTGDIVRFCPPLDRDAEWHMFEYRPTHGVMVIVNWIGYKAGLENNSAMIPKAAFVEGKQMVRLSWFKENWNSHFIGRGSFEDAQFYKFAR